MQTSVSALLQEKRNVHWPRRIDVTARSTNQRQLCGRAALQSQDIFSASLSINIAIVSAYLTDLSLSPSVGLFVCVCMSVGRSVGPESLLWQNG